MAEVLGCDSLQSHHARVVQLGDLGGYDDGPGVQWMSVCEEPTCVPGRHQTSPYAGSQRCFDGAKRFMRRIPVPWALVTGNHDLEGEEFETDEANLAAWTQVQLLQYFIFRFEGPVKM